MIQKSKKKTRRSIICKFLECMMICGILFVTLLYNQGKMIEVLFLA